MTSKQPPKNPVKSTEKAIKLIQGLYELEEAGITELAEFLDLNKATVHHHLSTLAVHDFVVKENKKYRLGSQLFTLGQFVRRQKDIYRIAKPEVDALASETGEIANLMIEEDGYGVYLYITRGKKAIKLDTKVGTKQYLHTSALGKSILAHLPDQRVDEIIEQHGLPAETEQTVTNRAELREELQETRDRGFAIDGEERADRIRCVAAPVIDKNSQLLGAISVSGPSVRLKNNWLYEEIPELVQDTATVIAINATYSE